MSDRLKVLYEVIGVVSEDKVVEEETVNHVSAKEEQTMQTPLTNSDSVSHTLKRNIDSVNRNNNYSNKEVQTVIEDLTLTSHDLDKVKEVEENEPEVGVENDRDLLIRKIIGYGISVDGIKEKSSKLFDFSFDYRENAVSIEDLSIEINDESIEEDNTSRKLPLFKRLFRRNR